ncbi:MAG TPA: PcfJ domain-containing protein, partial [Usitatibacteraceae bacterium]|nr:PcfJ domain-containing protein [Usitatibacteraceae bacterium]
ERVESCRIEGPLRDRIAEALALDPLVVASACLGTPLEELTAVDSRQYSAAWRHDEAFVQLERENPALVRPYAGAVVAGVLGNHPEPARDLKLAFRRFGIGDAGWKLLANTAPGHFEPVVPCARNDDVFEVYCWILQACAAAGGLLPGPVLQRLVMPNGREPGLRVKLEPETIALDFWKPFLRALGRRLASVGGAAEIRAFLDGEFEDVYDWLEWEYPAIDANQARAGWAWMLAQHAAWQERERELAHAQREDLRWEVPLATFEHGPWRVVALRDSYELWEEGNALRHCARTYANHCRRGHGIVFSIRNASGNRVATGLVDRRCSPWTVKSVRMRANRPAWPELVEVARAYAVACEAAACEAAACARMASKQVAA